MKQMKMYVCTLEEFILDDLDTLLHKAEVGTGLNNIGRILLYIHSQQRIG